MLADIAKGYSLVYDAMMKKPISRYQFIFARIFTGLFLFLLFMSLLFKPLHYGIWQGIFPVQSLDEGMLSILAHLQVIPVSVVLIFSGVMSLILIFGWQRRFIASTIILGTGVLHHQQVFMVSPLSLLILVLLLIMMITPLGEVRSGQWKLPSGIFVFSHSVMVFFYVLLLNPFTIAEQLLRGSTSLLGPYLTLLFSAGILTLAMRSRRYIFWFFALALLCFTMILTGDVRSLMLIIPIMILAIEPGWWIPLEENESDQKILFYDGLCGLCHGLVRFVVEIDKEERIQFSALQSDYALNSLGKKHPELISDLETVVYLRHNTYFFRSRAALMLLSDLGGVWSMLGIARYLPASFSDALYNLVAQNRYKIFGKHDVCSLPTPEERSRFLESQVEDGDEKQE
jgi:predicted DCC family thiol-disulfide oxidoreductase YuxK